MVSIHFETSNLRNRSIYNVSTGCNIFVAEYGLQTRTFGDKFVFRERKKGVLIFLLIVSVLADMLISLQLMELWMVPSNTMSSSLGDSSVQLFRQSMNSSFVMVELHGFPFHANVLRQVSLIKVLLWNAQKYRPRRSQIPNHCRHLKFRGHCHLPLKILSSDTSFSSVSLRTLYSLVTASISLLTSSVGIE